jgi:hypothetical protein
VPDQAYDTNGNSDDSEDSDLSLKFAKNGKYD